MSSALPLSSGIVRRSRHFAFVPIAVVPANPTEAIQRASLSLTRCSLSGSPQLERDLDSGQIAVVSQLEFFATLLCWKCSTAPSI
jgi:hypothetical protein